MFIIVDKDDVIPIYIGPYASELRANEAAKEYGLIKFEIVMLIPDS